MENSLKRMPKLFCRISETSYICNHKYETDIRGCPDSIGILIKILLKTGSLLLSMAGHIKPRKRTKP